MPLDINNFFILQLLLFLTLQLLLFLTLQLLLFLTLPGVRAQATLENLLHFSRSSPLISLYDGLSFLFLPLQVEHFPPTLSLPSLPTFNKLDPQRLEIRRQSLERYITAVTGDQFLKERPQAMTHIILFLTEGEFTRNTSQLYRKVSGLPG